MPGKEVRQFTGHSPGTQHAVVYSSVAIDETEQSSNEHQTME